MTMKIKKDKRDGLDGQHQKQWLNQGKKADSREKNRKKGEEENMAASLLQRNMSYAYSGNKTRQQKGSQA